MVFLSNFGTAARRLPTLLPALGSSSCAVLRRLLARSTMGTRCPRADLQAQSADSGGLRKAVGSWDRDSGALLPTAYRPLPQFTESGAAAGGAGRCREWGRACPCGGS